MKTFLFYPFKCGSSSVVNLLDETEAFGFVVAVVVVCLFCFSVCSFLFSCLFG